MIQRYPRRRARGGASLCLLLLAACQKEAEFPGLDTGELCSESTWYGDSDGDGHGGQRFVTSACEAPEGYVESGDDCDDLDASTWPGADEVCGDGVDNDCDLAPEESCLLLLSEGTAFLGEAENEGGFNLAVGDIDGDGSDEIALGVARSSNADGQDNDGLVALFFGPHGADRALSEADARIAGSEVSVVGWDLLLPGDVDGDGLGDLVVAATQQEDLSGQVTGAVAMFSGASLLGAEEPLAVTDSDWLWYGEDRRVYLGAALAAIQADEDEAIELLGAASFADEERGVIYLLADGGGVAGVDESQATIRGEEEGEHLGSAGALASADLTGDGIEDLAIGSFRRSGDSGGVFVCAGPHAGDRVLSDCEAAIAPSGDEDQLGRRVARAGDVDGDGLDDLWAVAPDEDDRGIDGGAAYLLPGRASIEDLDGLSAPEAALARIRGMDGEDHLGDALAEGMDADGDGFADALMGASQLGQITQGVALLFYGPLEGSLLSGQADAIYTSEEGTDVAGAHVAFVPSPEEGGQAGILVDAPESDLGAPNAGAAWLVTLPPR